MLQFLLILCSVVAAGVAAMAWRMNARTRLGRCVVCEHDMTDVLVSICPECGNSRTVEAAARLRYQRTMIGRAALASTILLVLSAIYVSMPGPWTARLPRPIMLLMLKLAAPPPWGPQWPGDLPTPQTKLLTSPRAWDRCVWQYQLSQVIDAWSAAVLATQGPITQDELTRLAPLAEHTRSHFHPSGTLTSAEWWVPGRAMQRIAAARAAARDDAHRKLRLEFILSEVQFRGTFPSFRDDFARTPDVILHLALTHTDARVRRFGVDRFGNRAHEVVMDRTLHMPPGRTLVESIAASDPDPAARELAQITVRYLDAFLPGR